MDEKVAADYSYGIPGGDPAPEFRRRAEKVPVFNPEFLRQFLVFRSSVTHIPGKLHRLVVAQEHGHPTSGILGLLLELVEQPVYLHRVVTTVEYVPDHHELILPVGPFQILVNHPVGRKEADYAV